MKALNLKPELQKSPREKTYIRMKSAGYHGFNLYGFSLLKQSFPQHPFWKSEKMQKALAYAKSDKCKKEVQDSKYSFPYNPPGF
ncbi:MAG: hypothetical protein P5675_26370, partial [Limnospira sp. PMC 917.15]|nr:hypothetical protein [Limnospira sp. PMC 917.15]